ncbi:MAG TPA: plastocyanin/azurin family copper-binding protein [Candidatus Dormibacteraeota bacterium]|nr:plastocyanin/azurin family copper-binding protein [Candidatus Dormibacteraeota bacterium]
MHTNHQSTARKRLARVVRGAALTVFLASLAACGSTATTPATPDSNPTVAPATGDQVAATSEWKVEVPASIKAGQVNFKITNTGAVEHELLVFKADKGIADYPVDADGKIKEEDPSIVKVSDGDNIAAGASQTRTIDLTKPGRYLFVCNLPTHFKQGMSKIVTVS